MGHKLIRSSKKKPSFLKSMMAFLFIYSMSCYVVMCEVEADEASTDAYVAAGSGDARVLIPFFADDTVSANICGMVYNGLTKVDKDLNVVGDLAERWDISEDGKIITFHLRKGVRWHDGMPFTSKDVEYTFRKILDPGQGCPYIGGFTDIKKIEATDKYTVRFIYNKPYAPALLKLGMGIIPEHIFGKDDDVRGSVYSRKPIGTGPYIFRTWKTGQFFVLEANDDYFLHEPGIKRYVYRIIPDQSVQFFELVSGGIDSMQLNPFQYHYRSATEKFERSINKYKYLAPSYTYLGYNLKDPVLQDVDVRKALGLAIDKKEIIDSVLLGLGEPCSGHFIKDSVYYNKEVDDMDEYDPDQAVNLLKRAGWEDSDSDGILDKDGKDLILKIVTNQGNQVREDVATIVQSQWASIGVKAEIQVVAWAAFLEQFIDKRNFQVALLAWGLPIDPDCYAVWHSDSMKPGGLNFISYSNEEVDKLIEAGRSEFDIEKRVDIYREIHRLIAEDAPYTFLFFSYATPAINKRFKGIKPEPAGILYNFIDWNVPEDEVRYKF